jgi:hypothetical protein
MLSLTPSMLPSLVSTFLSLLRAFFPGLNSFGKWLITPLPILVNNPTMVPIGGGNGIIY